MKNSALPPLGLAALCTTLTVVGCQVSGMPPGDLLIAGVVALVVSAGVTLGTHAAGRVRAEG